jgi:hypothetical protein
MAPCSRVLAGSTRSRIRCGWIAVALAGALALASCGPVSAVPGTPTATNVPIVIITAAPTSIAQPPVSTAAPTASLPPATPSAATALTPVPTVAAATPATVTPTSATPPPFATPRVNIVVTSPSAGQTVSNPVHIAGIARVFEATVAYEIVSGGRTLVTGFTNASVGAPDWGSFQVDATVGPVSSPTQVTVRVFARSMKDGSIIDLVEVPVTLEPGGVPVASPTQAGTPTSTATRRVTVYLVRKTNSGEAYVAVNRDVRSTPAIGTASLDALLGGPTADERAQGLESPIPNGTALKSLRITDGVAYADFDRKLTAHTGGTARNRSIARVIDLTLEQFATVHRVVISVEGRTEGVVQP